MLRCQLPVRGKVWRSSICHFKAEHERYDLRKVVTRIHGVTTRLDPARPIPWLVH
jgi:hypothetical protein